MIKLNELIYGITEFRKTVIDDDDNFVRPAATADTVSI